MPRVIFEPSGTVCDVDEGTTILQASHARGVGLSSCCGGNAICTTCRVRVSDGMENLSPVGECEGDMLELLRIDPAYRLGCQAKVYGDVVVTIPD